MESLSAGTREEEISAIFAALAYFEEQAQTLSLRDTARFLRMAMTSLGSHLEPAIKAPEQQRARGVR